MYVFFFFFFFWGGGGVGGWVRKMQGVAGYVVKHGIPCSTDSSLCRTCCGFHVLDRAEHNRNIILFWELCVYILTGESTEGKQNHHGGPHPLMHCQVAKGCLGRALRPPPPAIARGWVKACTTVIRRYPDIYRFQCYQISFLAQAFRQLPLAAGGL